MGPCGSNEKKRIKPRERERESANSRKKGGKSFKGRQGAKYNERAIEVKREGKRRFVRTRERERVRKRRRAVAGEVSLERQGRKDEGKGWRRRARQTERERDREITARRNASCLVIA